MSVTVFPGAGGSVPIVKRSEEVIEILERALQQARDGSIVGVAIVKVRRQPVGFSQEFHDEPGTSHTLTAGVAALMWRLGAALNNGKEAGLE